MLRRWESITGCSNSIIKIASAPVPTFRSNMMASKRNKMLSNIDISTHLVASGLELSAVVNYVLSE